MTQRFKETDGGRAKALPDFPEEADDCVTRAIAIATGLGYREVHNIIDGIGHATVLWNGYWHEGTWHGNPLGFKSAEEGVHHAITARVMEVELPSRWQFHEHRARFVLRDLPAGPLVVLMASHVCAVIDHVIHDTWDCSNGGRANIFGYWKSTGG